MSQALGVLRWSPETFWKSTLNEWRSAMKGYAASKGLDTSAPVAKSEVDEAWAVHKERMKAAGRAD